MAAKKQTLVRNYAKDDEHRKLAIHGNIKSIKDWEYRWHFLIDEYRALNKERVIVKKPDKRELAEFPTSTNHIYGYIASNPEMKLETWGPDCFTPMPLPEFYKIVKIYE